VVRTAKDNLLSPQEVGDRFGVSVYTVRRWIQEGRIPAYKPGKEYRIRETDMEEFLRAREVRPKAPRRSPSEPSLWNGEEEERGEPDMTVPIDDLQEVAVGWLSELFYAAEMRRVCIERLEDDSAVLRGYRT
jgi:excisionase family DNA binding protein